LTRGIPSVLLTTFLDSICREGSSINEITVLGGGQGFCDNFIKRDDGVKLRDVIYRRPLNTCSTFAESVTCKLFQSSLTTKVNTLKLVLSK
jgi:hypothetical protein